MTVAPLNFIKVYLGKPLVLEGTMTKSHVIEMSIIASLLRLSGGAPLIVGFVYMVGIDHPEHVNCGKGGCS